MPYMTPGQRPIVVRDPPCLAKHEGFDVCENCSALWTYHELEHSNQTEVTHTTTTKPLQWPPVLKGRDWYRAEGFSAQANTKKELVWRSHLISPSGSPRSKRVKLDANRWTRSDSVSIHRSGLNATQRRQPISCPQLERRSEQAAPLWSDVVVSRPHATHNRGTGLNVPSIPDEPHQATFLRAHFDTRQQHRSEDSYRDTECYHRRSQYYQPGDHADRSGNGLLNTSGANLSLEAWEALSEGQEPRPTVSQKRLPGPYGARPSAPASMVRCAREMVAAEGLLHMQARDVLSEEITS